MGINGSRGQTFFMAAIVATMLFFAGMTFLNFIKDDVTSTRTSTALDCANTSISDGVKLTCLGVDAVVPYVFLIIFSAVGGIIGARLTVG